MPTPDNKKNECVCSGLPKKQRRKSKKLSIKEKFSLQRRALTPTVSHLVIKRFNLLQSERFVNSNQHS